MAAGVVSLFIFFATQPKPPPSTPIPVPGGGGTGGQSGGSGTVAPTGPPPLPSPTAAYTPAWQSKQQNQGINDTFDIGPNPPFQTGALQGFYITNQYTQPVQALTVNGYARMAQWSSKTTPTFANCVTALNGGSPADIPVQKPGGWICVQTPEGLIASLESGGFASNGNSVTLQFSVTVWQPKK